MDKTADTRMHSAEHILNQTMDRIYGCGRCFNAHVEKKKSKCDYRFDHALTGEEIKSIESKVNDVIQENLPVSESYLSRIEAEDRYNLGKVPENAPNVQVGLASCQGGLHEPGRPALVAWLQMP